MESSSAVKWKSPWTARLLAGLGIPFIIHHPPELRTVFRHYALVMMSYAEQTEETA